MNTFIPSPGYSREKVLSLCDAACKLYQMQKEFCEIVGPDSEATRNFDNGIFDCVTSCMASIENYLKDSLDNG